MKASLQNRNNCITWFHTNVQQLYWLISFVIIKCKWILSRVQKSYCTSLVKSFSVCFVCVTSWQLLASLPFGWVLSSPENIINQRELRTLTTTFTHLLASKSVYSTLLLLTRQTEKLVYTSFKPNLCTNLIYLLFYCLCKIILQSASFLFSISYF